MVFPRIVARPAAWLPLLVLVTLSGCKTGQKLSLCSFSKPAKSCATTCTSKPKSAPVGCVPLDQWKSRPKPKPVCTTKPVCGSEVKCGPKVSCATTVCGPTKSGCATKTSCAATCIPAQRIQPKMQTHVQPKIVPKSTPVIKPQPTPVIEDAKTVIEVPPFSAPAIAVPKKEEATPNYDGPAAQPFPMNPAVPPVPPEPTTMNLRVPARTASNTSPFRPVIIPGRQSAAVIPAAPSETTIEVPLPVAVEEANPFDKLTPKTVSQTKPVASPKNNLSTAWADAIGLEDESQLRDTPIISETVPEFRRENQPQIATPDGWKTSPARVVGNIEEVPERN